MARKSGLVISGLAAALAFSCGSQQANTPPEAPEDDSFAQARQQELESERKELIRDRGQQLDELEKEISRLEVRLEHEGKLVSAEERAEWSQKLFELRQDHRSARAELDRASQATPEEWEEMRGSMNVMVDTLQAGVSEAGSDVADLFRSTPSGTTSSEPEVDLCDMQVEGADATIVEAQDQLVVQMTTQDQDAVDELRERAEKLSQEAQQAAASPQAGETEPGAATEGQATGESALIASVSVENIEGGVRVIFTPAEGKRRALREQLENEVEQIRNERC